MDHLEGSVAVVTGAASGIGRALSERFASEGMRVVLADIEADALEATRAELAGAGHEVLAVRTDVTQADSVQQLAERAVEAFGKVHVVCNNAGVFAGGRTWEAPLSDYEWVMGVNIMGVVHGLRSFVPLLLEHGEPGHVVNTASMAGVTSAPLAGVYYMSKHAVMALSESLYHEMVQAETQVGVSVLCPELIHTAIARSERNRPHHLKRDDRVDPQREVVEGAIRELIHTGLDPSVMADRVVDAMRENRFYILSEEGGSWRQACEERLEDIRLQRNPTLSITANN